MLRCMWNAMPGMYDSGVYSLLSTLKFRSLEKSIACRQFSLNVSILSSEDLFRYLLQFFNVSVCSVDANLALDLLYFIQIEKVIEINN